MPSDNHIINVSAGLCSRRQSGEIRDLEWKRHLSLRVLKRIVMWYLCTLRAGTRTFYNLANICKALGIKFNIAMLYLADENVEKNKMALP